MSNPQYPQQPTQLPSEYELAQWQALQQFKQRPLSRAMRNAGEQVSNGVKQVGKRATKRLENYPRAKSAVSRGQEFVAKGTHKVGVGARGAADALPDWSGTAVQSIRRTLGRLSRAGLSSKRVVALHNKRGHDVARLSDVRRLDLEQVDAVRGRAASWYFPAAAALSGASAGLVISGGQLVIAASAGAAAAPTGGAITGAFVADTAFVLGLASRAVGQVSLFYGYDPEEPAEKLFVMSVVNVGTASSATAKNAAMADISRLTQALFRGKTWEVLNETCRQGLLAVREGIQLSPHQEGTRQGRPRSWNRRWKHPQLDHSGRDRRRSRGGIPTAVPPGEVPASRRRGGLRTVSRC